MQLKTITNANDAPFPGVEFVKTDKHITEVVIAGKLRVRVGESYNNSLKVLVETPHVEETRWMATATIEGFGEKVEYFAGEHEARAAFAELEGKGADVSVARVTALVDENGKVVGVSGEDKSTESGLPF